MNIPYSTGVLQSLHLIANRDYCTRYQHVLRINRELVCDIQGQFIAFSFLANDKHRELKNAIKDNPDPDKIMKLLSDFETITDDGLEKAIHTILNYMDDYFRLRVEKSKFHTPRFCIKIEREGKIIAISNTSQDVNDAQYSTIQQDTGLKQVIETRLPYLQNNIPKAARAGNYENCRLRNTSVLEYREPNFFQTTSNALGRYVNKKPIPHDIKWMGCWHQVGEQKQLPPASRCYKSTLVTPISLRNNIMPRAFLQKWLPEAKNGDAKLNYGFLCADCHDVDFFEEDDKEMCYIFADCISLFLITHMYLRDHSALYRQAKNLCKGFIKSDESISSTLVQEKYTEKEQL